MQAKIANSQSDPKLFERLSNLVRQSGIKNFFAYLVLNNNSLIGVSTSFDFFHLNIETRGTTDLALLKLSRQLDNDGRKKSACHIIRHCHECSFIFYASDGNFFVARDSDKKKLIARFEFFCLEAMNLICPKLKLFNPQNAKLLTLNNPKLRERIIAKSHWPLKKLTPRESDCLHLASQGLSAREIADRLFKSPHTITENIQNIKYKLGANAVGEALLYSLYTGIINNIPYFNDSEVYVSHYAPHI